MTQPVYALVITPHPDDAEFGASGTVARWTREGKEVAYVVCTNGDKGTSNPDNKPDDLARTREQEQLAAAEVLGVREVVFLRYPDQTLEDTPEFRRELVRQIRKFRPYVVITASPYRRYIWHRDHRIAGQVALDAIFPYARDYHSYPELIAEGLMPHKVKEVLLWAADRDRNFCSNITDTFAIKLKALRCHESQIDDSNFPDIRRRLEEWARDYARDEDYKFGEAFYRAEIW